MFDSLSNRLTDVLDRLKKRGALSVDDVTAALREVRVALLEADVALGVVKDFTQRVKDRALGSIITLKTGAGQTASPADHFIAACYDELVYVDDQDRVVRYWKSGHYSCRDFVGPHWHGMHSWYRVICKKIGTPAYGMWLCWYVP